MADGRWPNINYDEMHIIALPVLLNHSQVYRPQSAIGHPSSAIGLAKDSRSENRDFPIFAPSFIN
jgi:hypothetical protein